MRMRNGPRFQQSGLVKDDNFAWLGKAENVARPLVEKIRVEAGRAEQGNPMLQFSTLGRDTGLLNPRGLDLLGQPRPGNQPIIPLDQMVAEIANRTGAEHRKNGMA